MSNIVRGRGRIAAALVASAALVGSAATVTATPAANAAPTEDCIEAAPVSGIAKGDLVDGLTVDSGTDPAPFSGTVLGVIRDGIAPGLDMIMADLDSTAIEDAGGIWAGMSGSPVYDSDGKLIGAVAYGLSWGPSPIAGITPFEKMDDYLPQTTFARKVELSAAQSKTVASAAGAPSAKAMTFKQLRIPRSVVGLTEQRINRLKHGDKYTAFQENQFLVKKLQSSGGGVAPAASSADDIEAGGNLAATASYGDITFGGVGTATSVCNGGVVGFGHPFDFMGDTSLTMHPADALYIQPDSLGSPFKVANLGAPAGVIDGDHLAGISGSFGPGPETATISSHVSYQGDERTGSSEVSIADANASVTFYEQLANHDAVLDAIIKGSSAQQWTITGDDNGEPFELSSSDVYTSNWDIAYESVWELADLVYVLSDFPGVTVDSVTADSAVNDNLDTMRVVGLQQKVNGGLVDLNRRHPAVAHAGGTLKLLVTLKDSATGDLSTLPMSIDVPGKAGRHGYLYVEGGANDYTSYWRADNVSELKKVLAKSSTNDEVVGTLGTYSRRNSTNTRVVSDPTGMVVEGRARAEVKIK